MAKNTPKCFDFEFTDEALCTNRMFYSKNRLPSFQDSCIAKNPSENDSDCEVFQLREMVKDLEEKRVKDREDFINKEIAMMSDFQVKEGKIKQEFEELERKYNCMLWKLDSAQKENKALNKQVNDLKKQFEDFEKIRLSLDGDENVRFIDLVSRYKCLEVELEAVRIRKGNKIKLYQKKLSNLQTISEQVIMEKNKQIEELEEMMQESKRKSPIRSPLRGSKTPRRNSHCQVQEISQMIVMLERSQAEYKQKYLNLQKSKSTAFGEISHLHELLKNNEKRLREAKKLQEKLLKSN